MTQTKLYYRKDFSLSVYENDLTVLQVRFRSYGL
jgi:hypothetical protein